MKFKFKIQDYQTAAVASVVDCFAGQLFAEQLNPGLPNRLVVDSFAKLMEVVGGS